MRRAGDRVFRYAGARREEARHEVHLIARRGHDDCICVQRRDSRRVGPQRPNILLGFEERQNVARRQRLRGRAPSADASASVTSIGLGGIAGKSMRSASPFRATASSPLRVVNFTTSSDGK